MSEFSLAYEAHGAGRLDEAERLYRAVLEAEPKNADAWHLLGVLAQQRGQAGVAVEHIERALGLSGPHGGYLSNLGVALQALGRSADAVTALEQAIALDPGSYGAHFALGNALRALGRLEEAAARYTQALALEPGNASAHNNLGNTMQALGRLNDAAACFRKAITLQPNHGRAHYNLGVVLKDAGKLEGAAASFRNALPHLKDSSQRDALVTALCELGSLYKQQGQFDLAVEQLKAAAAQKPQDPVIQNNLGTALIEAGRAPEAEVHLREAIALAPAMAETPYNLGNALKAQGKDDDAIGAYKAAIGLRLTFMKPRINLGVVLRRLGRFEEAYEAYDAATRADPNFAAAFSGRGVVLQALGRDDEALESFDHAVRLQPEFPEAHRNRALALLMAGKFKEGWEAYEWRWACGGENSGRRNFPYPQWQGEDEEGAVLVWGEQGVGDKVLYAGMIPDLIARGHKVVMETDYRLMALFERSFPGLKAVNKTNPPDPETQRSDIRWHCALASLGRVLRPDTASFPKRRAYLVADEGRRRQFRESLDRSENKGPVVGISWASRSPKIGQHKTLDLMQWAPILKIPGVRFVDLQYGETAEERAAVEAQLGVPIAHMPNLDLHQDIDGIVALAAACDIVISVSNTTAHLAAALGRPTWVMVPASAGNLWYWMRDQDTTPWYPSAVVFKQPKLGEWAGLIAEISKRLKAWKSGPEDSAR